MCIRVRAAALPLLLLLTLLTQTGCLHTAYVSDKINQTMTTNSGVLTAAPGTPMAEVKRQSGLQIGEGVGAMGNVSRKRTFSQSKRFDWQLPNSNLLFKNCNSYSIHLDEETGATVTRMQIGTAQRYYTWAEVKAEMLDIEQRLLADGWKPERNKLGRSSSDKLREELEKPDFNQFDDDIAAASYGKGDIAISFYGKLARNKGKAEVAEGQNFSHYMIADLESLQLVE